MNEGMMSSHRAGRRTLAAALPILVFCVSVMASGPQAEDPALQEKIAELVRQLSAEQAPEAQQAEQELLRLGSAALRYLPDPTSTKLSADQRRRLQNVLPQLWQASLEEDVAGKAVLLPAQTILLRDALKMIEQQTGNLITDLRGQFNQSVTNPQIVLSDSGAKTFWETLDQIAQQAEVTYYYHTEEHAVGLIGRRPAAQPVAYAGAFRFAVDRLALQTDFSTGDPSPTCVVTLSGLVEPRLRPLLIEFDSTDFSARDDRRRDLKFTGPDKGRFTIEHGSYQFPLILRMAAPPRDATLLTELFGELKVWLPARTAQFEFADLEKGRPMEYLQGGLKVSIGKITDDDGVWAVPVTVDRSATKENLDSHLQIALQDEIYLLNSDGSRFNQNGGLATLFSSPEKTTTEYVFVDAPGALLQYKLIIRIPANVTAVPVRFRFQNLILP